MADVTPDLRAVSASWSFATLLLHSLPSHRWLRPRGLAVRAMHWAHEELHATEAPVAGRTRHPGTSTPGSVRATTQPPKPAPVSRAPSTPGVAVNRPTSASRVGVLTSK